MRQAEERRALDRVPRLSCDTSALASSLDIHQIMREEDLQLWKRVSEQIDAGGLTHNPRGINPGDRRMLCALVAHLQPRSVLEVGTHIGSSTLTIAATLAGTDARITTVDIIDVNDAHDRPWLRFGSARSPAQLVRGLALVDFVVSDSVSFLSGTSERFDFVFLDGGHHATTVYRELPLALSRLRRGGVVLLHDYFPDGKPLWSEDLVIPGPWLALRRLIAEGARLRVLPCGALPWPTKAGSRVTTLAVVLRA